MRACLYALCIALAVASPAAAEDPDIDAVLNAPDLSALSHDDLSVRLAFRMEPEISRMMQPMIEMITSASASNTEITSEQRTTVARIVSETFADNMGLLTRMNAQVYRQTYEPAELIGIIAFYESEAGRAFMMKSPQAIEAMGGFMPSIMQKIQADLVERLKQEAG